jgi:hypothetical protein
VSLGTSRSWSWDIEPEHSGQATVVITAATYDGRSSVVLNDEVIPIRFKVLATSPEFNNHHSRNWWERIPRIVNSIAGLITVTGSAVAVVAGGIAWLLKRRKKKDRNKEKEQKQKTVEQQNAQ